MMSSVVRRGWRGTSQLRRSLVYVMRGTIARHKCKRDRGERASRLHADRQIIQL